MKIGEVVSCGKLNATHCTTTLEEYRGKWIVLYFYPKDATPGCTLEGQDFRDTSINSRH